MKKQTAPVRVSVSRAALFARINRQLRKQDEALKVARSEKARQDLGDFYLLNLEFNGIIGKDVNPAELGRELGVLRPWEVAEDFEEEVPAGKAKKA